MHRRIVDLLRKYPSNLPLDFIARALETPVQALTGPVDDLERRGVIQRTGQDRSVLQLRKQNSR